MDENPAGAFLLPGPVKMHPRVLQAMAAPAMNHRGPEFKEILSEIRSLTQYLFGTRGEGAVLETRMDPWGIAAFVRGSQKCLAAPPALSAVALSKAAYESLHADTSFYANLKAHTDALAKQDTPFTPAVPLFLAFREALRMLKEEGLDNRIARTRRLAEAPRAGVDALWLRLFPDRRFASNTVTAVRYPTGVDDVAFRKELREKHGTVVAGGQGPLKGHIFRIGHMGICSFEDLEVGFQAFETTLTSMGHKAVRGAAVDAIAKHA